jgi:type IV secretory pathway protease TraF
MWPALPPGKIIIATRYFKEIKPNDRVIISHDKLEKIKRVSKMREGRIFVIGDNADSSTDSRHFGWLPPSAVIGKVIWPPR